MQVRIIATGGTFDKEYNELTGELFFRKTHLPEILKTCRRVKEKALVITHGTDTMEKTALFLGPKIKDKTVILTGAMIPYKFGSSDGIFNLASAISFAQALPFGVYVAMNGKLFNFNNVTKNKKIGIFENKK